MLFFHQANSMYKSIAGLDRQWRLDSMIQCIINEESGERFLHSLKHATNITVCQDAEKFILRIDDANDTKAFVTHFFECFLEDYSLTNHGHTVER